MGCCSTSSIENPLSLAKSSFIKRRHGPIQNYYEILDSLGEGGFGIVYRVKERNSGLIRAMKEITKSGLQPGEEALILNEIQILSKLDHPNIMKIYEVIESSKYYYILCELLTGGELFDLILKEQKFDEKTCAKYLRDLLSGIFYCHRNNFVHNDIKPENLLLESKEKDAKLKLIDFGIARSFGKAPLTGRFGTVIFNQKFYMAPEIFSDKYNEKIDIWSAGVLLFMMLSGSLPFKGDNNQILIQKICEGKIDLYTKE